MVKRPLNEQYNFLSTLSFNVKPHAFGRSPPLYVRSKSSVRPHRGGSGPHKRLKSLFDLERGFPALMGLVRTLWLNYCWYLTVGGIEGVRRVGGGTPYRPSARKRKSSAHIKGVGG